VLGIVAGGAKFFQAKTFETDEAKAAATALRMVDAWRREIAAARGHVAEPASPRARQIAYELSRRRGEPLDDAQAALVMLAIDETFKRYGLSDDILAPSIAETIANMPPAAQASHARIIGGATPFLAHFNDWYSYAREVVGRDTMAAHIKEFANFVNEPLETLSGKHVQRWSEHRLAGGPGRARDVPHTITIKLSNIRHYWMRLISTEKVASDRDPFEAGHGRKRKLIVNDWRTPEQRKKAKALQWEPEDMSRIIPASWQRNAELGAMVEIMAWTGARLSSVAELHVDDIHIRRDVRCFTFRDKSKAGVRYPPIVPRLNPIVDKLIANATDKGFLFHAPLTNPPPDSGKTPKPNGRKYGKMFGAMTKGMEWPETDYRKQRTMHSVRHTVTFMFAEIRTPLEIRAKIMGHATTARDAGQRMDEGSVYGRRSLLDWMMDALNYPQFRADGR
jgi:integrase